MRWDNAERFTRHSRLAIPTCITIRVWRTFRDTCMPGSLTSGFFEVRGIGGEYVPGIYRRMRNPQ